MSPQMSHSSLLWWDIAGEWVNFLLLSVQTNHKNGGSYPEEQLTLNKSDCLTDRFLTATFSTDGPQHSAIWDWMRHKTFSLVTISNHSLVILPGISVLTTVEFGFHILLKPLISVPVPFPGTVNQTGRQSTCSHLQLFHMQLWDSSDLFLFVYSLFACVQQNAFPCTSYTHIHYSFNFCNSFNFCITIQWLVKLNTSFVSEGVL